MSRSAERTNSSGEMRKRKFPNESSGHRVPFQDEKAVQATGPYDREKKLKQEPLEGSSTTSGQHQYYSPHKSHFHEKDTKDPSLRPDENTGRHVRFQDNKAVQATGPYDQEKKVKQEPLEGSSTSSGQHQYYSPHKSLSHENDTKDPSLRQDGSRTSRGQHQCHMPRRRFPTSRRYRGPNSNSRGAPRASRRGGMPDTDRKGGSPHRNASPLVRMIVEDLQPLSTIERAGFRGFMRALNPGHGIPKGISSLRSELLQLYGSVKRDVKASLCSAVDVVLTSETWTRGTETYQTVGCHFIDQKWELKSYVLETKDLTGRHTGDEIFNQLQTISQEWEIREKIHAVVMNEPNILPPGSGWAYFPCFADTLDRVFKKALSPANKVLLESYHKAARCLHLESSTTDEPNDSLPPYQLTLSGHIGWTAALNLLEKIPIDHSSLHKEELAYINNTVSALRLFEDAAKDMSQQKYVSVSCIIPLARLLKGKLQEQAQRGNEIAAQLGEMLKQRFKDIEMNYKLVASTTLDARFKDSVLTGYSSTDQSRRQKLLQEILNLGKASQSTCTTPATPDKYQGGLWKDFDKESACEEELRRYTAKENIPRNGNPLSWWRFQNDEFPNLKRGARRYLGIVCTCVPPARAFSKAGHVFSLRRLSLEPENINVMLFLNHNGVVAQEA